MTEIKEKTNAISQKNWLQRLKNESWEAELLVSAVAIFAILKSFAILDWLIITFIDRLDPSQYDFGYFILVMGYLAIGILAAMFTIHFVLRAYWIGLVGLNSVFPDYGLEDSAYSPIYTKKILGVLPKINQSITKIDELCSVIFSAAFAFMLIYLFATVSACLYLILFNFLEDYLPFWLLILPLGILALILIFGMIISIPANMKKYHSNNTIQHLYFLYARWGALTMYGPLYKSILQITMLFGSNFKKKKGLVKMVLFMLFIGIVFGATKMLDSNFSYLLNYSYIQDTTKFHSSYYANNNIKEDFLFTPEIDSDVFDESTIKLFIPLFKHEIKLLKNTCEIDVSDNVSNKKEKERNRIRNLYLDCYQKQNKIFIDDKPVQISFLKTNHSKTDQYGILGYINIDIKKGQHRLLVQKTLGEQNVKEWTIPFFYAGPEASP